MWIQIGGEGVDVSPVVVASAAAAVGVILIIAVFLCCCLCCRQKDRKEKERTRKIIVENSPEAKGYKYGAPGQQQQQQNNQQRMVEHDVPNQVPPAAVLPLQHPPRHSPSHLPPQSSLSSNSSNSLPPQPARRSPTPQTPSAYASHSGGSEISNLSRNGSSIPPQSPNLSFGSSQIMFTSEELAIATNGFSKGNILGQGGFGFVHKGVLPNGKEIAVKSLKADSGQGEREFQAEVEIISRVHHRHLVSLVGYCMTGSQRLLVYEFVPNKTLEFHLYGNEQPTLNWPTRMKIAVGAAKGLAYLHEDCHPRIIHRDIKAANILLDNNFEAKVADFGLAKFNCAADTHVSTRVMGTLGYLAPEYASSGKLTEKSDVYSFGVMLLELITGRRPVDRTREEVNLVEWARLLLIAAIEDENYTHLVDPQIQSSYKHSEMSRMVYCAATCVRKSARRRPLMSQIVRSLEGNMSLSDLSEGITPGRSLLKRYDSAASDVYGSQYSGVSRGYGSSTEFSGSLYKGDSRGYPSTGMGASTKEYYVSNEHDGATSEYGLYVSSSSSDGQTTRELSTEEVMSRRTRRNF